MARAEAHLAARTAGASARARGGVPTYAAALKAARSAVGALVKDRSGVERLDICNAEGAVLLGWADARVESAVAGADDGRRLQAEAAERIGIFLPCAEAVAFRSSLNAAMADALTAAKALTGRDGAFFCDDDTVATGDVDALSAALDRHAGQVAAVVIRPMEAEKAFLLAARRLTSREGALLLFDESRTAFRMHTGGAQAMHGVVPDLALLGPSLANGRPIAAVTGRVDAMQCLGSSGAGVPVGALAAACATLERIARDDVADSLTLRGAEIEAEIDARLRATGADAWFGLFGDPSWSLIAARPFEDLDTDTLEAALAEGLYANGVLSFGAHVPSMATGEAAVARLLSAYDAVLPGLVERASQGAFTRRLRRSALSR